MRTKIKVADVMRIGGCQSGIGDALELIQKKYDLNTTEELEFSEVVAICRAEKNYSLAVYFIKNKPKLLEYTDANFDTYIVAGQKYADLDVAKEAVQLAKTQRIEYHKNLTSVTFSESVGEDATWSAIDIDTFQTPEGVLQYHFHVFNHKTGTHEEAATLDETKDKRDAIVQACVQQDSDMWKLVKRSIYAEDGESELLEVIE